MGIEADVADEQGDLTDAERRRRGPPAAQAGRGLSPRRAGDRRHGIGVAGSDLSVEHRGDLEPVGGRPCVRDRPSGGRIVGQGLRLTRGAALQGGRDAAADLSLRRLQGRGRHDRPQLLAHLRAAGRGDALREPLRWRRPQLLAAGARDGERSDRRPPARDSLGRQPGARLPLRRGRRAGLRRHRRGAGRGAGRGGGLQRRLGASERRAGGGRADLRARRRRDRAGHPRRGQSPRARSTASSWTRPRSAR